VVVAPSAEEAGASKKPDIEPPASLAQGDTVILGEKDSNDSKITL
jgi:hypothetical protein